MNFHDISKYKNHRNPLSSENESGTKTEREGGTGPKIIILYPQVVLHVAVDFVVSPVCCFRKKVASIQPPAIKKVASVTSLPKDSDADNTTDLKLSKTFHTDLISISKGQDDRPAATMLKLARYIYVVIYVVFAIIYWIIVLYIKHQQEMDI